MGWHRPDNGFFDRERAIALFGFLPAIVAFAVVAAAVWRIDRERTEQFREARRAAVEDRLLAISGSLSSTVRTDIALSQGLVSALSVEPDMTQAKFEALASGLFGAETSLNHLAAAPDLVVRLLYPLEPNRKALGLDYRTSEHQRDAVLLTLSQRRPVVTGPVDLVQGGIGLIIRYPVYRHDNGELWGLLSSVLDLDKLYRSSGLLAFGEVYDFSLAKTENGAPPLTFFTEGDIAGRDPVSVGLDLGDVHWSLSAVPKAGWEVSSPQLTTARLEAWGVAICILLPLVWTGVLLNQRYRRTRILQQREADMLRLSQRLGMALSASSIGVWELDTTDGSLEWDDKLRELFSAPPGRGRFDYDDWRRAVHPDDLEETERQLRTAIETGRNFSGQFRIVRPDGEIRHIRAMGHMYAVADGVRVVGVNWDVTEDMLLTQALRDAKAQADAQNAELRLARHSLEHLSMHDALTGLPNRRYLDLHLSTQENYAGGGALALLHVDLDRFKEINDTLGHATGDHLLVKVGERLSAVLQPDEFAARVGGDEFVVVIRADAPAERAQELANAIISGMAQPFDMGGTTCRIGCSVGVAIQSLGTDTIQDLLINADIALYEAKKQGRSRVEQFTDQLRLTVVRVKAISDELVSAIERDEFFPVYQPQFDAHTFAIVGVEALARWNHPTRGILPPGEFLSIANDLGLVGKIDEAMLEKGLRQLADWRGRGLSIPKLSVNISFARLQDEELFRHISRLSFEPGSLSFELLESISFDDGGEDLKAAIARLKEANIGIEIDDFGTGHASIVNLLDLAPDRLKIDRKLVASVEASGARCRLVASIIEMGRALGIGTVAEGVETMPQAKVLGDLGCDALQGYALAKPMQAEDLYHFVVGGEAVSLKAVAGGFSV
ncbi:EAL domain-containing protein [Rhizobiaceae bacterium BDR2-2]|uniref:EAL domain-containing protein n=1 Tax=Ectorhizobium quercum TaxID=2965071 RepID=A0AAE3SVH5_9HYPH|nr:EAL domain-containing protein [Ectorhizobium quercum]MCX8996969.1 EAL domain-containing protein [Ectorhizobium quercum]